MGRLPSTLARRLAELETATTAAENYADDLRRTVAAMRACRPNDPSPKAAAAAAEALDELPAKWREILSDKLTGKPYLYHEKQAAARMSTARFRAIEAGRRSGKTADRKAEIVERALDIDWFLRTGLSQRFIVVGAPTQDQTERAYLDDLVGLIPKPFLRRVKLTPSVTIELVTGAVIRLAGMDRPQRAESTPIDDLFLDEMADMRLGKAVITKHLRASLSTRGRPPGSITAFGTTDMVSGASFVELCDEWLERQQSGDPDYAYFHWTSEGIANDWAEARATMTPEEFAVEYEARRVSTGDLAYYRFRRDEHIVPGLKLLPDRPVMVCFDWNLRPATATILQDQSVEHYPVDAPLPDTIADDFTAILGEAFLRQAHAPTLIEHVFAQLIEMGHKGDVIAYGDPAGASGTAAAITGSCVEQLEMIGERTFGRRFEMRFDSTAPRIVYRLSCVNRRLKNADGFVRLVVDASCVETIKDFEQVHVKQKATGKIEIEKPTKGPGKERTHLTDGLGYMIAREFPLEMAGELIDV